MLQICTILPGSFVTFYNGSEWPPGFALAGLFSGHVLHFFCNNTMHHYRHWQYLKQTLITVCLWRDFFKSVHLLTVLRCF